MKNIDPNQNLVEYTSKDGKVSFNVNVYQKSVWLTQAQISELFDRTRENITMHIRNIFKEKELDEILVCKDFLLTANDGKKYNTKHYNLDLIMSVGYRVKSKRGMQFRKWATKVLKDYLLNGYAINSQRIRKLDTKIDLIIEDGKLQKDEIKQIKETQSLMMNLIKNPVTINNYIDQKTSLQANLEINIDIKKGIEEFSNKLKEVVEKLDDQVVKYLITDYKKETNELEKNSKSRNRILQFISDLGDQNSPVSKLLKGAGMAKSLIKSTYDSGKIILDYFC